MDLAGGHCGSLPGSVGLPSPRVKIEVEVEPDVNSYIKNEDDDCSQPPHGPFTFYHDVKLEPSDEDPDLREAPPPLPFRAEDATSTVTSVAGNQKQNEKKTTNGETKKCGQGPHQCDVCHKRFQQICRLTVHYRTHTGDKPHECDICQSRFCTNTHLKTHRRTHTGEKPYECVVCHKKFKQSSHLTNHYRSHTDVKNYECDVCSKRFKVKSDLCRHRKIHSGEKPFTCDECGRSFGSKQSLPRHLKTHCKNIS